MRYTHLRAKDLVGRLGLVCDGATLAGLKFLTYSLATKLHLQSGHHPKKVRHRQYKLDYRRYLYLLQNPSALNIPPHVVGFGLFSRRKWNVVHFLHDFADTERMPRKGHTGIAFQCRQTGYGKIGVGAGNAGRVVCRLRLCYLPQVVSGRPRSGQ